MNNENNMKEYKKEAKVFTPKNIEKIIEESKNRRSDAMLKSRNAIEQNKIYTNKHKKTEFTKKGDLGLLPVIKGVVDCRYSVDTALKLNQIIENQSIEVARRIFYAALKRKPNLPLPFFFVKDGLFVGYSVDEEDESFIPAKEFFNNPQKYIQKHKELKEIEDKKVNLFREKIKIVSDLKYRFKKLDVFTNLESISTFFLYLHTKNFGKVVEDNSYISTLPKKGKKYFVMRGYFEGEIKTLIKNSIDKEETKGFPMSFGYSFLGYRRAKKVFVVNNIYEVERFAKKEGALDIDFIENFFIENKFIILNGIDCDDKIFSGKNKEKVYINSLLNDPVTKKFLLDNNIQICDISKMEGIVKNKNSYENIKKCISYLKLFNKRRKF